MFEIFVEVLLIIFIVKIRKLSTKIYDEYNMNIHKKLLNIAFFYCYNSVILKNDAITRIIFRKTQNFLQIAANFFLNINAK